jgi:hypothetical protein
MVQVEYKNQTKEAELTGQTVAEARRMYEAELGFSKKTAAVLNGVRVSVHREGSTVLHDDDTLVFRAVNHRVAYLLGALLLALAVTGGTFASGFVNGSSTLTATIAENNFAEVSVNTTVVPSWQVYGGIKGSTGNATLFDVDTASSGYTGDLTLTVSLANVSELSTIYRSLSLSLELRDAGGNLVDINEDGNANAADFVVLTLNNGAVIVPFEQSGAQVYTMWMKSGSFIAQMHSASWATGSASPQFFCEVSQR